MANNPGTKGNVSVKFCGHCAPRMDMMELFRALEARMPEVRFRYYAPGQEPDVLLILNACQAECASQPECSGVKVVVSPETVDHWPVPREQLCGALCRRLSELCSGP